MSISRDRELADTLYALVELSEHLKHDLNLLVHSLQEAQHAETGLAANTDQANKALEKTQLVHQKIESLIKLLLLNHTDATSILNEFEKIRTTKLLTSETFSLAHILKAPLK
ncbi:MAG: hypothetical protein HQ455_03400 [Burkholderiales bacterium]|jgi:hypothetical protein|nr:hypothetical protein [Burkholderiales bacterium]